MIALLHLILVILLPLIFLHLFSLLSQLYLLFQFSFLLYVLVLHLLIRFPHQNPIHLFSYSSLFFRLSFLLHVWLSLSELVLEAFRKIYILIVYILIFFSNSFEHISQYNFSFFHYPFQFD